MAEDSTNPFAEMLGALKGKSNVTSKGIRKDAPADKVKPNLTSPEITRYKKIFGIMKDVLNPGPEAKRLKSTKAASIGKVGEMQKSEVIATAGSKKPWLKMLLLALGVAAAAWLSQFMSEISQFGLKMLLKAKIWFKPVMKVIQAVGKFFTKTVGVIAKGLAPVMKVIGRVTKFFGGAVKAIKASKTLGKIMKVGGSLMKVIKTAGMTVGKTLMKFGRFLPWIGSLFSFGFAIAKYIKGDLVGGTLELVSGIINLIPGGVFVSAILDGYILYRDFTKGKEDSGVDPESGEPGMLSKIWTSIKGWFSENYKKLPIIAGVIKMGEAAGHLLKGEWAPGFRALYQIMPSLLAGSVGGDLAGRGFDFVMGLFETEDSIEYDSINTDTDGNSFSTMVSNMFSSIGSILGSIWGGIKNKVKMWKNKVQDTFYGWASATGGFIDSNLGTDFFGGNSGSTTSTATSSSSSDDFGKMMAANSAVMAELNSVNKNQLNVLISIRDGISTLVSRNSSGSTTTDFSNNPLSEQFYEELAILRK